MALIAHYRLNENFHNLAKPVTTEVFGDFEWVDGKIGKAAYTDSVSDYFTTDVGDLTGEWSITFWYKCESVSAERTSILSKMSSLYENEVSLDFHQNGVDMECYYGDGAAVQGMISFQITDLFPIIGEWYHVIITKKPDGKFAIFRDGYEISSTSTSPDLAYETSVPLKVMNYHDDTTSPDGAIQDLRVYKHQLSKEEIDRLKKAPVLSRIPNGQDNTGDDGIYLTVSDSTNVLGDTTISFWVYPTNDSNTQTIWNNGYGGEGTINLEAPSNMLRFYCGPNGGDSVGGEYVDSSPIPLNQWTHVSVTRNMDTQEVKWYINGVPDATGSISFSTIGETTFDPTIGSGYTSDFIGELKKFQQWASVLSPESIEKEHRLSAVVDSRYTTFSNFEESGAVVRNILDYSTWEEGVTGSVTGFSVNGSESETYRGETRNPFGGYSLVWEARPELGSGANGGWNTSPHIIDPSKMYRISVWIRRTIIGNGDVMFGVNGNGGDFLRKKTGVADNDPRFWTNEWEFPTNQWVLVVGHVWPYNSITGDNKEESGLYTVADGKIGDIDNDFIFPSDITEVIHRAHLNNSTDTSTRQQFLFPRIDIVGEYMPSINALLSGFDARNYERTKELSGSHDGVQISQTGFHVGGLSEVGTMSEKARITKNEFYSSELIEV